MIVITVKKDDTMNWFRVIGLFLFMCGCCVWYFYDANADQEQKIACKLEQKDFMIYKIDHQKNHDRIEKIIEKINEEQIKTNLQLNRVITILEERPCAK